MSRVRDKVLVGNEKRGFNISNENYRVNLGWNGNYVVSDKITRKDLVSIPSKESETFHTKKILAIYGFELVDYVVLSNHENFLAFFNDIDADISITAKGKIYINGENVPKQYIQHKFNVIINF